MQKTKKSEQIVEQIEALLIQLKRSLNIFGGTSLNSGGKSRSTISREHEFSGLIGKIHELIGEGFFKDPKTISEISKRLQHRGYKTPTTALSGPLLKLVRKDFLKRDKPEGKENIYKYSIKK